jgi:hypothetical protein
MTSESFDGDAMDFFFAAVRAVVCGFERPAGVVEFRSGRQMWDWVIATNPVAAELVAGLTEVHRRTVREVLDRMLRERRAHC